MANEKIEVGYRHIGTVAGVEYHHKFLLYTDRNGRQYTISGWTDDANQNPSLPFGNIRIQAHWKYDSENADHLNNENAWYYEGRKPISPQKQYREPIEQAPDLSTKWAEMVRNAQSKDNIYPYDYLRQNSNTLADTILREAGFPEPEKDGMRHHLSPGSGNRLDKKLVPKNPDRPSVSDIGDVISFEEDSHNHENNLRAAEKSQSKYDEVRAMIHGLLNDHDGSFAKQILAENKDVVDALDVRVQAAIERDKQRQMSEEIEKAAMEQTVAERHFREPSFG